MRFFQWTRVSGALVFVLVVGCGKTSPQRVSTGSKEAAKGFYESLVQKNWTKAYAAIDAESRSQVSAEQFADRAEKYLASAGFEPTAVQIRAWNETNSEATVHVVLTGRNEKQEQRYKAGITLRRGGDGWWVVLPSNFGQD